MMPGEKLKQYKSSITILKDLVEWVENIIKNGEHLGMRSLSGFTEYLIRNEKEGGRRNKYA